MPGLDPGIQKPPQAASIFTMNFPAWLRIAKEFCEERRRVPRLLDCRVEPGND
jgi:hypothetical protein